MKLSKRQKEVIVDLQKGASIITTNEAAGAIISLKGKNEYHIGNRLFWNLVNKGLIAQMLQRPFWYILTPLGEKQN